MVFGKWRSLEHMEWRFVSKRLFSWLSLPSLLWQPGRCSALKLPHPLRDCQRLEIRLLRGRWGLRSPTAPQVWAGLPEQPRLQLHVGSISAAPGGICLHLLSQG